MSYLKATRWRPTVGVLVVLAMAILWLMGAGATQAGGDGNIFLADDVTVGVGGTTTVDVSVTAPDSGLSVWIIEIEYNPAVVRVDTAGGNPVCTTDPVVPGTQFHGEGCATKDVNPADGTQETAVAFGAWVAKSGTVATGWTGTNTVAKFTFKAVGTATQFSNLTIKCVQCLLGPAAQPSTPTMHNGKITITAGTTRTWGNTDCSLDGIKGRDVQALQKYILGSTPLAPHPTPEPGGACPAVNAPVMVNGVQRIWGNWDCSLDGIKGRDGQALQKQILGTTPLAPHPTPEPGGACPAINATVTVS